jgi:hypothetical protein
MRGVKRRSIQADLEAPDMLSRRFDLIKDRLIAESAKEVSTTGHAPRQPALLVLASGRDCPAASRGVIAVVAMEGCSHVPHSK